MPVGHRWNRIGVTFLTVLAMLAAGAFAMAGGHTASSASFPELRGFATNAEPSAVASFLDSGSPPEGQGPLVAQSPVPLGSNPRCVAYDSDKKEVFVANYGSNNVSVISDATNLVVATVVTGSEPYGVAYDSGKKEVFVANYGSNNVSVISEMTDRVVATVTVGSEPVG